MEGKLEMGPERAGGGQHYGGDKTDKVSTPTYLTQPLGSKVVNAQTKSSNFQCFQADWYLLLFTETSISFLSNVLFCFFNVFSLPSLLPLLFLNIVHCFDISNGQKLLCIFLS